MATFRLEYTFYLGDIVQFKSNGIYHTGLVQSVHDLPDIWVECVENGSYHRYRVGIDSLELIGSNHNDSGTSSCVRYIKNENIEFVRGGALGTKEFNEIIYNK